MTDDEIQLLLDNDTIDTDLALRFIAEAVLSPGLLSDIQGWKKNFCPLNCGPWRPEHAKDCSWGLAMEKARHYRAIK